MAGTAVTPDEAALDAEAVALGLGRPRLWWIWLVAGIAWIVAALVILQFDSASIKTTSIILGGMFVVAGVQLVLEAVFAESLHWMSVVFGALFICAGIVVFLNPEDTFAGLADTLGFCFALIGLWWTIEALLARGRNALWWLGLSAGILMLITGFWTAGQFFVERAYVLLVFAGTWALLHGITDIARAFAIRDARA
ncbi:MAG: HdeD family acid-resistance protein [Gemmatimonadaceae bacterium]